MTTTEPSALIVALSILGAVVLDVAVYYVLIAYPILKIRQRRRR